MVWNMASAFVRAVTIVAKLSSVVMERTNSYYVCRRNEGHFMVMDGVHGY